MTLKKGALIERVKHAHHTAEQITVLDTRYYRRSPGVYYPSVTFVLSHFPKGKFFEQWVKDVGQNAEIIMRRAADEGTQVHDAAEAYLNGEEVTWLDHNGRVKYNLIVWKQILRFVDFWETVKPKLIKTEEPVFSDELKASGTADLVVEIDGEVWLLDIKTSKALYETYDLQLGVYATAWNECFNTPIQRRGILWLKASTRGPDKSGKKIQGKGWRIAESKNTLEEDVTTFKHLYEIFKIKNPDMKPVTEMYPTSVRLKS